MKRNLWKRTVSLLMSVVMLMSLMVVPAQAEGTGAPADAAGAPVQASQQEAPAAAAAAGTVSGDLAEIVTECPEGVTVEVKNNGGDQNQLLQNEAKTKWFLKATQDTEQPFSHPALAITVTIDKTVARGDYALIFDYAVETSASVRNNFGVANSDRTIVKELYGASKKVNIETSPFQTAAINLKENGDTISIDYRDYADNGVDSGYLANVRIVRLEKTHFTVTLPDGVTAIYSDNGEDPVSLISGTQIEVAQTHDVKITATIGAENKCMQGFYRSGDTVRLSHKSEYTFEADADPDKNKYEVRIMDTETEFAGYENLTVKTEGTLGWTKLADGSLASGNQMIAGSGSPLSITANKAGTLMLDYKVSSEAWDYDEWNDCFTGDGLVYAKGTTPSVGEYGDITGDNGDKMDKFSGIMTKWETLAIPVNARETVYFLFCNDAPWDGETFAGEDTAWIRNIFLSSGKSVTVSVTADKTQYGTVSGDNLNQPVPEGSKQTYTATAKDGGQFYGWFDGSNKLLSRENTYTCVAKSELALVAKFDKPAGNYEAWNKDKGELGKLADVVQGARSGDTVLLTKDTTLSTDLTIPAGVTLVVPCEEDDTGNESVRSLDTQYTDRFGTHTQTSTTAAGEPPFGIGTGSSITGRNGTRYRTLTIESGNTLTVNGTLVVNAVVGRQKSGHLDQDINGGYGCVVNNGTIDILSGGAVDAFGLIEGESGNVTVQSGGTLTDLYVVINWRGGSQAAAMYGAGIYPMNEYKADNISSTITVYSGGTYSGFVRMFASNMYTSTRFPQVDNSNGLIRLKDNATLIKKVSTDGREHYTITGGADFSSSTLTILQRVSLSTKDYIYPFNGTYDFALKNGDYAFTEDFKFMPGVTMTTDGANLVVNEGKTVVFYDKFDDINETTGLAAQYPHNRPAATLTLSDNSTLTINGTFAGTVVSGLNKNNIKRGAKAVFEATTKEAGKSSDTRELSFQFIPSTFGGYKGGWVNNVYTWEKDKYTITFDTDGGDAIENMTVAWGETLNLPTPTKTGYTFAGWYNGETKFEAKVMPSENLILIAKWTPSTNTAYKVEHYWQNLADDGYTLHETETKTGTTGAETAAAAKSYPGFTAGTVTQPPIAADGSTVVKIYYTRNSYTLTWNFDGGKENATGYTSGTVKFGAAINKPSEDPTKTGYTFAGWSEKIPKTMPANNLTVKAQWKVVNYSISYNLNGGTDEGNPNSYTVESDFTLKNPTKEGYTFAGWSGTDISGTEKAVTIKNATGNREYTANWTANQYTITFNTDGGSEVESITQDYGTTIAKPTDPTKTGYTFAGWSEEIPATMPAGNMTVKAKWTINKYTITFNTDGGSEIAPITQDYGTDITAPANPTKEGYTFAGWDENIPANMPAKNMTIKAKWAINQYTVTFKNGDEVVKNAEMDYGSTIIEPEKPTKEGYTFKGWQGYTTNMTVPARNVIFTAQWTINQYTLMFKNGETVYKTITQDYGTAIAKPVDPTKTGYTFDGWDKEIPTTMPAGDMTIKAQWTANQYTVTFDSAGGSACDSVSVTYDRPYGTLPKPTKEGYTFTGWYDNNTLIYDTTLYRTAGDKKLTAHWGIVSYTITYSVDNKILENVNDTREFGASLDKLYTYTKTGYTVSEWTQSDGSQPPTTMPARQVYLYATTTPISYTISYQLNGGTNAESNPASYTVESGEIKLAAPSREGYTFQGWKSGTTTEMAPVIAVGSIGSRSYEAVWRVNSHTLKYMLDGKETSTRTVNYGTAVAVQADPTKTGYTFSGWKVSGAEPVDGKFTMPDNDVTITGGYTANTYTVKFDANGGSECEDITVTYDGKYTDLPTTTRTGYTFDGWYDGSTKVTADTVVKITADQTLTARWTANKYTVTFDANGGSACKEITVTYDGKYPTLPAPTKEGYTFKGWFDGETQVKSGDAVTITGNQTLTARWSINTYTITYQVDGQTVKTESVTYGEDIPAYTYAKTGYDVSAWSPAAPEKMPARNLTFTATTKVHQHSLTYMLDGEMKSQAPVNYGTAVAVQADPTKTGYTFSGWTVSGAKPVDGKFTMPDNNVTITGSFSANTYTVKFNANGGEGSMADQSFTYDAKQALAANGFTRTGWRFTGWKLGNTTYTDGQTVSNLTAEANGTVTLEAQWEHILYTLKFVVDKSGKAYHTEQKYYGDAITPPEAPEKAGYRFDGWDREIPATMPDGDLTITAKWSSYLDLLIAMGDDFAGEKLGIARGYYQKMNGDQRGEYQSENEGLYNAFVTAVTNASVAALEKNVAGAVVPTNEKLLIEGKQIAELTLNGYDVETRLIDEDYPAVKLTTVDFLTVLFGYGEITSVQVGDQPEVSFKDGTGGKQMELMLAVARQAGVELQDSAHTYISVLDGKSMPVMLNGKTVEGITYSVTYQLSFFNNTHKITWNANGGVGGTTTTGTYGKAITAPTVTRVGYTFAGWDKAIPETMGKTALTFTAKWTANTDTAYTVQHHYETLTDGYDVETVPMTGTTGEQTMAVVKDKAGFTAGTVAQATIAANGSTVVNIYYTRNSYTLTVDADNGTAVSKETYKFGTAVTAPAAPTKTGYTFGGWDKTIPESMPAGDMTIKAQWKINQYTITFNTDGGSEVESITQDYGTAITAPAAPTKTGYTFAGWSEEIPATMPAENMTVKAQWKINQYTITFDTDGGSEIAAITQNYGTTIAKPTDPTKTGYTFGGWDKTIPGTMPAENMTVTATWKINQYTITFDTDGGSAVKSITQDYGTDITAPANPNKTGYTFAGWSEEIPATMPAGDMTVTAKWKINQYTITFDTDGGSEIAPITQDYNTAITAPAVPTKTGYTFDGWDKEIPGTMSAGDMTVTATWKINQYTITFDTDGGSAVASITQDYGTAIIAPKAPTKTGYTFDGWDKTIPGTMPAEDVTVTATWKINQYTITFNTDGGSEIAPITQDYGTTIAKPTDPTKTGYTFAGWYTDAACTNAWNFGSNMLADHDMTLYARWVRNAVRKATITGSVELGNRPAVGAVVELMLGNRKIAAATTDANGVYSFQTVETGLYNIVAAKDGKTRTALVNVDSAGSYTVDMIVLPGTDVSFEVRIEMPATPPAAGSEPKADVSKTTVGGLDAVADKYAESGKKVALLLTITPKTAEEVDAAVRAAIEERSAGQKIEFVDMTLSKSVDDVPATTISSTGDRLLTINIPFATSGVSVGSMAAYRCIDGKVETLTSTPNADGEFIEVRGGVLVVHTGKPATYAIGYRLRSGSSYGGTYSLTSGDGQNGKAGATLQFGVNSGGTKVSAVYVDGTQLGGGDYTVKGTIVRLKGVYTATLAQGYHFGTVYYDNGYVANFSFTLSGETSPRTADMGIGLYAALALTSLTGMAWVGKRRGSGRES